MGKIYIKKSSGEREPLKTGKIINALKRSGAGDDLAERIAYDIGREARSGMSTKQIFDLAYKKLRKSNPAIAARYSLRDGIFKLGPAGFEFEKYIMLLFCAYGYKAQLPEILEGKCINHEVDILAEKDGKTIMMECKLRHATNIFIEIKDTMATWARFMDLRDGAKLGRCPMIDECWLVTNSRFSYDSQAYGECKKMNMLSWNSPSDRPLPAWIDSKNLYPVTVLESFKKRHLQAFSNANILLLKEITKYSANELARIVHISKKDIEQIVEETKKVLAFKPKIKD